MSLSSPFIRRPIATTLLTIAVAIAGAVAFTVLPVSRIPYLSFGDAASGLYELDDALLVCQKA